MTSVASSMTVDAQLDAAVTLRRRGRSTEAEVALRELVKAAPRDWRTWANLGQLLKDSGRPDEAAGALRRAVAIEPGRGALHAVSGECLYQLGRLHAADAAVRRSLELGFDGHPDAWILLAKIARALGRADVAFAALGRAEALAPAAPDMHMNLGIMLTALGRFDAALERFDAASAAGVDPTRVAANRAFTLLTAGSIAPGWAAFESFFPGGPRGEERRLGVERWTPADRDARVLCYREQGVGDEMLFASCLDDLLEGAGDVVYECDPRLVDLFARSFPNAEVRAQSLDQRTGETMSDFDRAIPIGSLPQHFRPDIDHFPAARDAYLVADAARVAKWQARLGALGKTAVAFSWRSQLTTAERRMEYTRLTDDWGPLFAVPGITWVSVQYDECERELQDAEATFGITIQRWADVDYMNDFDEVAAIMAASDLVVAPRNAVAMLAGALGVPTVMMGNRWDWSDLGTDTTPWFPTVQLTFRALGDEWDGVITAAAARVATMTTTRTAQAELREGIQ